MVNLAFSNLGFYLMSRPGPVGNKMAVYAVLRIIEYDWESFDAMELLGKHHQLDPIVLDTMNTLPETIAVDPEALQVLHRLLNNPMTTCISDRTHLSCHVLASLSTQFDAMHR